MKRALVLGGGGAKGSYQVGVWKALRMLNMKFDIVTGASIGSINGALYASNKYFLAKKLWKQVKTSDLFDYSLGGDLTKEDYKGLLKEIIKNGGMSFDKAGEFLKKYINEQDVKNSKIDFGLITVSLNTRSPKTLTKEKIPDGKLIDYICASSICYPFVSKKEIDGESYIDGGFYDGLPINLAIDMGATEILAIDLNVIGMVQKPKDKSVKIDYIKFKDNTPLTLTFTKEQAIKNMKLGFNDTMKHFNKLDGNIYTFKKGDLNKNYIQLENKFMELLKDIFLSDSSNNAIFELGKFNKLFSNIKNKKNIEPYINESLEYLGEIFSVPSDTIYNINSYNKLLVRRVDELNYIKLNKNLKGKFLISYMYNKYKMENDTKKIRKEFLNIALLFPKDFLAGIYLICLTNKYQLLLKTDELYEQFIKALNKR